MPDSIPAGSEAAAESDRRAGPKRVAGAAGGASLHGEILARLRDYIVEGDLPAGARVPERQLCEMFGISRTPLREALKVLAAEGLVDLLPNRGARVRVLSAQDIHQLFDLMAGLEALAGRLACEAITEDEIADIERLHHTMYIAYMRGDLPGYFQCNQLIHKKIVEAARNQALAVAYAGCAGQIQRIRYAANLAKNRDRWGEAMREHEAMLDALHRRAGQELSDILFMHLRNKRAAAIAYLAESQPVAANAPTIPVNPQDFAWLADH